MLKKVVIVVVMSGISAVILVSCASRPSPTPAPTLTPTAILQTGASTYAVDVSRSTAEYTASGPFNMQLPGTFRIQGDKLILVPEDNGYRVKILITFDVSSATAIDSFMRSQLLKSMDSDKYPTGRLTIDSKEVLKLESGTTAETELSFTAAGSFEVHGQEQRVELPVTLRKHQDTFEVDGQLSFKPSDYHITMPVGVSSDNVLYKFHLVAQNDTVQMTF